MTRTPTPKHAKKAPPKGAGARAKATSTKATGVKAKVDKAKADAKASSTRQGRRALALLVSSVVAVGILFAFVLPARTYLGQRAAVAKAEERVKVLDAQNDRLKGRADALRTDEEVERLAREQYGMARKGEEAYAILPAPAQAAPAGEAPAPAKAKPSRWDRLVDAVTFWN